MIHNHEVPSSILGPATKKAVRFQSLIAFFLCFFFVGTQKNRIFAPMKPIIPIILLIALTTVVRAQDVVRLLQPAYADSGAVYRQSVYVPQKWEKRRVVLFMERPLGATAVKVNGIDAGGDTLVNVPQQLDITNLIVAGQRNTIQVSVAGHDAHGVMGNIELRSQPRRLYINKVRTHPRPFMGTVGIELELDGQSPDFGFYDVQTMIQRDGVDTAKVFVDEREVRGSYMKYDALVMDDNRLWDEFHPNIFRLALGVGPDYQEYTFGMREAGVVDGKLYLNRHPVYLRGCVMDDYFPLWDRMPMDEATWMHIMQRLSDYGLNHVRFCGYCPPDAAFTAADKVGMYLQPEAASLDDMKRITEIYGHHPSLVLVTMGQDTYVYNDCMLVPVVLNQRTIVGPDMLAYKQGVERVLLSGDSAHYLLAGFCDRQGDFSGVLHGRWDEADKAPLRQFNQFCRAIVPLARLPQGKLTAADTLRVPVYVYNAMYGNLQGVRTSYYLASDSAKVLAGGMIANGDVPLDSIAQVGEIVLPLDSIQAQGTVTLMVTVGNSAVRNYWNIILNL